MEYWDVVFLEYPTVSHKVKPQCVELYEISKGKGVQTSGASNEDDSGDKSLSHGPLEVIE